MCSPRCPSCAGRPVRPGRVDPAPGQPIHLGEQLLPPTAEPSASGQAGDPDTDLAAARDRSLALLRPVMHRDTVEDQHDPSAALGRLVDARDRWCAGVGCSSTHCHRDHLIAYPQGPTAVGNLGLKSPRCHGAKHNGWTMVRHPDGSVTWTSPLGRTYRRPSPHNPPPAVLPPPNGPRAPSKEWVRADDPDPLPEPPPHEPPTETGWPDEPTF